MTTPVRVNKVTIGMEREWVKPFLAALSESPNVSGACKAADISRKTAYDLKANDRTFADAWEDAIESAVDELVGDAWKRAKGDEGSDKLTMFLLQAHRRSVYGQKVETEQSGGMLIEVRYADPPPETREAIGPPEIAVQYAVEPPP